MKQNTTPHLIWAVTLLIVFGVTVYFGKGAMERRNEQAERLIDAVVKSLEEGHIRISVDLGVENVQPKEVHR